MQIYQLWWLVCGTLKKLSKTRHIFCPDVIYTPTLWCIDERKPDLYRCGFGKEQHRGRQGFACTVHRYTKTFQLESVRVLAGADRIKIELANVTLRRGPLRSSYNRQQSRRKDRSCPLSKDVRSIRGGRMFILTVELSDEGIRLLRGLGLGCRKDAGEKAGARNKNNSRMSHFGLTIRNTCAGITSGLSAT